MRAPALHNLEGALGGELLYDCLDIQTGERLEHRSDEPVTSASTYKLPLLLYAGLLVEDGALTWDTPFLLREPLKGWGTGILKDLSAGLVLPLHDVCTLMVALSDNTAANLLVDACGLDAVNARLATLGFKHTRLIPQAVVTGSADRAPLAAGITTPGEMTQLLVGLARYPYSWTSQATSLRLLDMLGRQQDHTMIGRALLPGWHYAGKTGSNPDLRADVGLLTRPDGRQFALALYAQHPENADWSVDSPGVMAVARLAQRLVKELAG